MTRDLIIQAVKSKMADISPIEQTQVTTDQYIDVLLDDCEYSFYKLLPIHLLPETSFLNSNGISVENYGDGVVVFRQFVPEKFVRLIKFKCKGWIRAVYTTLKEGSWEHKKQLHRHTCGGLTRPYVTLVDIGGTQAIEFYSIAGSPEGSDTVTEALCCITKGVETIPKYLLDAFEWYVVSVVYQSMEEYVSSENAFKKAITLIQNI